MIEFVIEFVREMSGSNSWKKCVCHRIRGKYEYMIQFIFHEFDPLISRTNSITNSKIRNSWEMWDYHRVRGKYVYIIEFVDAPKSRIVLTKSSFKDEWLSLLYLYIRHSLLHRDCFNSQYFCNCSRDVRVNDNCMENWNNRDVRVKDSCPLIMTVTFTLISRLFRFSIQMLLYSWYNCFSPIINSHLLWHFQFSIQLSFTLTSRLHWRLYWESKQSWYKSECDSQHQRTRVFHFYITTISILNTNVITPTSRLQWQ